MREFWIRLSVFFILWIGLAYQYMNSHYFVIIVIFCTFTMIAYFFLPIYKKPVQLYYLMTILIVTIPVMVNMKGNPYFVLLLLYLIIEAISQLTTRHFRFLLLFVGLLTIWAIIYINSWNLESVLLFSMFFFLTDRLNTTLNEQKDLKNIYDQLVVEYRKLKRTVYESDQAARLEERTKIARDIHDSVGHKLTALLMQLEMVSLKEKNENIQILKQLARESLEETRDAVKALRFGEHEGIATVLHLIRKLESESHIHIHFTTKQGVLSTKLSNKQSIVLYRTIQEALTNAMRHAQSREVKVVLGKTAIGDFEFTITNTIYEQHPIKKGFGLTNMEERLKEIGGKLQIYQVDHTFIVNGTFPLKGEEENVENFIS